MTDDLKRHEWKLPMANWLRDQINEVLARYDVPSDVYDADVQIDALCICAVDKIDAEITKNVRNAEVRKQALRDTLLEAQSETPDYAEIEERILAALDAVRASGDGREIRRLLNQLRNLLD